MDERLTTEEDYRTALKRFLELFDLGGGPDEVKELYHLIHMLETYEYENC